MDGLEDLTRPQEQSAQSEGGALEVTDLGEEEVAGGEDEGGSRVEG